MATKTFYLLNALASGSNHMDLQDGGTAPGTATTGTGWTVAKIAADRYARMDSQTERASGSFGTVAQPDGAPDNTLGDCFRTPQLNGDFAAGNWDFQFPVMAVSSGGDQDGAIRFRLWKSANADGSGATEVTAATQQCSTVTNLTTSAEQISSLLFNPGAVSVANQYLFVQLAWRITGAGTRDVLLRIGSSARILTTDFTAGGTTFTQALAATALSVATILAVTTFAKTLAATAASVAALTTASVIGQTLSAIAGSSAALSRVTIFAAALAATVLGVLALTRVTTFVVSLTALAGSTATLLKTVSIMLAAIASSAVLLLRLTSKTMAATVAGAPLLTQTYVAVRSVAVTAASLATLTRTFIQYVASTISGLTGISGMSGKSGGGDMEH